MSRVLLIGAALLALAGTARAAEPLATSAETKPAGFYPCEERAVFSIEAGRYKECRSALADFQKAVEAKRAELQAKPEEQGCIGKDTITCFATLSLSLTLATYNDTIAFKPPAPEQVDIEGKPVPQPPLMFKAFVPGIPAPEHDWDKPGVTLVIMSRGGAVQGVEVMYGTQTPLLAHTQLDWDRTGAYELARAIMGQSCVGTDKLAFYRSYNQMNKGMSSSGEHIDGSYADPGVWSSSSNQAERCGAIMDVGLLNGISAEHGTYGGSSMMFRSKTMK